MSDKPTIPPALTPREWGRMEVEFGDDGWASLEGLVRCEGGTASEAVLSGGMYVGTYGEDGLASGGVNVRRHALAALALHGQPFGFTREDIQHLRWAADLRDRVGVRDAGWTAGVLRNLAARIEALLPPEDTAR